MKKGLKRGIAVALSLTMMVSSPYLGNKPKNVSADTKAPIGSLSDKVTGTWSYWDGEKDVVQTNEMLLGNLPTMANKGKTRWTTDNYDENNGALAVSGWATSMMWTYLNPSENGKGNPFGNSTYAIPLSYKAAANGMMVTKPPTTNVDEKVLLMNQPESGALTDFILGGGSYTGSYVDKVTEWSTDVVLAGRDETSNMKVIMTQGSPFTFVELDGTNQASIIKNTTRALPSYISNYNGSSVSDSTMIVLKVFDNHDQMGGYSDYDYYAVYVPEGTVWSQSGTDTINQVGRLTATFPEGKEYYSFAWLCETKGMNDAEALTIAQKYQEYAYNFITNTETSYSYDKATATVTTEYKYTLDRKAESTKDGTIMGILPHQYKNMNGYTYLNNEARTIRGNMKYLEGSSYETKLKYTGILPSMPEIYTADHAELAGYVSDFMAEYGPTETKVTKEEYGENTYDSGKKMNRAIQVMEAAEECGDTESAAELLRGLEAELADWFTYTGEDDEKYFYYDEEIGTLLGFPQSYYTVDGLQDHHFHYGYFIQAAAQVTLRDPSFAEKYGNVIDELIGDIVTPTKNSPTARYPFLRQFSTWEGHAWASGHGNFADGNNQESSSESLNSSAALIIYGQATHNEALTELGIYLYTTEISSVQNYWFDLDGDILDPAFKRGGKYILASIIWGGKYDYAAWWTAEPLQIQGINLLPMTPASFYHAANTDYIIKNWETALSNEASFSGDDKDEMRWREIWSEYIALADPAKAMEYMDFDCAPEAGESKAHAFHYIMALDKAGTPDLSVTSDTVLSSVFKDADGAKTYVVYNAEAEEKTVTFSDGMEVVAPAGKMTTVSENDAEGSGRASYKVEHYIKNADGTYMLFQTESKSAKVGNEVEAAIKKYAGYAVNENAEGTILKGTVAEDGSLVLRVYYDMYNERPTTPAEDPSKYTSLGKCDGLDLSYYILQNDFGTVIKLMDGGMTFYMEYNGEFTPVNTESWLNKVSSPMNLLNGVYKFNPTTLPKNKYSTIKLKSGSKGVYVIVKYGEPTEAPDLSDYEGEVETPDPNLPTDVAGIALGSTSDNTINVSFRATDEQIASGQTYNVYIDGEKRVENVAAGNYTFDKVTAGRVTVKVTAVLNGHESAGVTATCKVNGEVYEKPTEAPTTQAPTTDETTQDSTTQDATTQDATTVEETTTDPAIIETTTEDKTTVENQTTTDAQKPTENLTQPTTKQPVTDKKVSVKKAKIKKAKRIAMKKAKVSLKKLKRVSGYAVKYSTSKKFKKKVTKTKYFKKAKFTLKKLKAGKKYYVKARAYKKVNGKKYFGKWSRKKIIKVKR